MNPQQSEKLVDHPYFIDEETEALEGYTAWPRLMSLQNGKARI